MRARRLGPLNFRSILGSRPCPSSNTILLGCSRSNTSCVATKFTCKTQRHNLCYTTCINCGAIWFCSRILRAPQGSGSSPMRMTSQVNKNAMESTNAVQCMLRQCMLCNECCAMHAGTMNAVQCMLCNAYCALHAVQCMLGQCHHRGHIVTTSRHADLALIA